MLHDAEVADEAAVSTSVGFLGGKDLAFDPNGAVEVIGTVREALVCGQGVSASRWGVDLMRRVGRLLLRLLKLVTTGVSPLLRRGA